VGGDEDADGEPQEGDEQVPLEIPASAVARRSNRATLVLPLACVGVLAAIAAWLLHNPEPKLEGTLKGARLTDNDFGPFRVDNSFLGIPIRDVQPVLDNLESEPIRAVSPILVLEFQGSPGGINVFIRAGDGLEFYRVDPRQDRFLAKYLHREKERLETARINELTRSVPAFLKALQDRPEGERDLAGLAEFRNSVGLASIRHGFGLHVQAVIGRQSYPCVHEDGEGRLYFSLPVDTREFEITGRGSPGRDSKGKDSETDAAFPGRYKVVIAGEPVTVNKEAPDPKRKIRKLLRE
jgi:hypothetical protein